MPTHVYSPRGTARELQELRDPEIVVAGPAGTGKSRGCLEKIHFMCLVNPGMRALITRKTMRSLAATGLVTYRNWVAKEARIAGDVRWYGGSGSQPPAFMYRNGSEIVVGGMDNPDKIMSAEYDTAYVQEATELNVDDWEAITSRLRNGVVSFQQLIADCNPSHPMHWLKQRCEDGKAVMLNSTHEENPVYFDDQGRVTEAGKAYIAKLDNLTGVRYLRLRKGLWVAAEGVIFEDYDPHVHLVDRFSPPESWPRYWTVDFGYTNPFSLQMWAVDPDGRAWMYREFYGTRRLVEDWATMALNAVSSADPANPTSVRARIWNEPKPRAIVCDHDAEGRATLEKYLGRGTTAATKDVDGGIQIAQGRFRVAGDGRPRVYFMRNALAHRPDPALKDAQKPACLIDEIVAYVWDTGVARVAGASERVIREIPLKRDDHAMDCFRYLMVELDVGRPTVRRMWGGS